MSEEELVPERSMSGAFLGVVAVALLAALGALAWCYGLSNHLAAAETKLAAADTKNAALAEKLEATNARLKATSETLGQSVGMTQKQIDLKTQSILAAQREETPRPPSSSRSRPRPRSRLARFRPKSLQSRPTSAALRPMLPPRRAILSRPSRKCSRWLATQAR